MASLPPGWVVQTDRSNRQFFYHRATGKTSWERPKHQSYTYAPEVVPPPGTQLPLGWAAHKDPKSGRTYYVDTMTGASQWTSPVTQQLPPGWEAIKDPTTGRLYYANKETGQTQWSLPTNARFTETPTRAPTGVLERRFDAVADTPLSTPMKGKEVLSKVEEVDDDDKSGTWKNVSPMKVEEKNGTEQKSISVPATSVTASVSGYGSTLNVPTTTAVAASSSSDSSSGSNGAIAAVVSAVQSDAAVVTVNQTADDSTLPLGWKSLHDPSTGKTYYYSAFTGKTQWSRPTIPPAPPVAPTPSTSNMPANWKAINDPKSGRTYYYNSVTGVSQWNVPTNQPLNNQPLAATNNTYRPAPSLNTLVSTVPAIRTTQAVNTSSTVTSAASTDLPPNWTAHVDPKSSKTYYYNKQTDSSSWIRPTTPNATPAPLSSPVYNASPISTSHVNVSAVKATTTTSSPTNNNNNNSVSKGISPVQVSSTPINNNTPVKSMNGTPFSPARSETDDLNMSGVDINTTSDDLFDVGSKRELPPGWKSLVETSSGKTYYYDTLSGTTSWEAPYFLSMEKAAKMRVRAASMTQVALTQAARFSPEEYATLLELPETYRDLAKKGGTWLTGGDFIKLKEATAAMNAFQEGVRNRGVRLTATEAAKLRMTADGVQRILDTPTMMGGLAMSDDDKSKLGQALVILREFSLRADGASGLKPVTLTAADSARLREATAMVKEVGDKINGNRSSATKKPRPKSLPSQGIAPIGGGAAPAHPTGL